jgi:hypothetical protein
MSIQEGQFITTLAAYGIAKNKETTIFDKPVWQLKILVSLFSFIIYLKYPIPAANSC